MTDYSWLTIIIIGVGGIVTLGLVGIVIFLAFFRKP